MILHEPVWQSLLLLAQSDEQAVQAEHAVARIQTQLAELVSQKSVADKEYTSAQERMLHARCALRSAQQDLASLETRIANERKTLAACTCAKTCVALEHELGTLMQQRTTLDEAVMTQWFALEEAETNHTAYLHTHKQETTHRQETIEKLQNQLRYEIDRAAQARAASLAMQDNIGPTLLAQYKNLHTRIGNPLVAVQSESCPGCFYAVPAQDLCALKRCQIVTCKSCFRMLFLPQSGTATPPVPTP